VFVGVTYLDHAGTTLYSEQHLSQVMRDLSENIYGNPHSGSECSQRTTELVELVRLRYENVDVMLTLPGEFGRKFRKTSWSFFVAEKNVLQMFVVNKDEEMKCLAVYQRQCQ